MYNGRTRRRLAGLGVAGALVAAFATPAGADPADITLDLYVSDVTVAPGPYGKVVEPLVRPSAPTMLQDATLRWDFTDLAGKVRLSSVEAENCTTPEENVLVCTKPGSTWTPEWGWSGLFSVAITPTETAVDGDSGELKVTLSASGQPAASTTARVRIGEGVDLVAGPPEKVSAGPGEKFSAPLQVENAGQTVAKGVAVVFWNPYAVRADKRYSNCTYVEDELRSCRFTGDLAPGATYTASLPYRLAKDTYAPGGAQSDMLWMTPAELEDFADFVKDTGATLGEPGSGGELTLSRAQAMTAQGAQADRYPYDNHTSLWVNITGENGADLAALGDKVTGKKDDVVRATVGFHNNGPATLVSSPNVPITFLTVQIPTGTTAVEVPDVCVPLDSYEQAPEGDARPGWQDRGKPGASAYFCYPATSFLPVGAEEELEFGLRIDTVTPNASGDVKINVPCKCDEGGFSDDLKKSNDTAELVVNATSGNGSGGGGGGDGGTLPLTGSSTGTIATLGGLLLAVGLLGVVLARRGRTRFIA